MVKAVLFDLDGTLIHSANAYFEIFKQACHKLGLKAPQWNLVMDAVNTGGDAFQHILTEEQQKNRDDWVKAVREEHHHIWEPLFKEKVKLVRGVKNTLVQLKSEGYLLAIVTSSSAKTLFPLNEENLLSFFDTVVTAEDVRKKKPDPEPVLLALRRLNVEASEAVLIGDTPLDIVAGQKAGTATVAVLTGTTSKAVLEGAQPDAVLPDITYLIDFLESGGTVAAISGTVVDGLRVAKDFTQIDWVQRQVKSLLGFNSYPGTLNLELDEINAKLFQSYLREFLESDKALKIMPDPGFCDAFCLPIDIEANGIVAEAAILYPQVDNYPPDKLEIIAPVSLKQKFGISNGDRLNLYIKKEIGR